ncbi:ABC transporter substrate-binding protein [Paraburkholderia phymatum]|uniref:NMT1/THI5 like domain protein n=1 Tax=Paraburkholderia phymatum (strain DSM 17167 / CIP 108236 / LMG 21445 / STM815) TaxID=391038 RepID=B2JRL1_PARP8|nr:ABC transporter substrate-binding protein [Paraburkholderia phymatum]ACC72338.1 NMT1/THI5 like domain protein [Paraburkholderia phymatum STM815]
MRNQFHRIFVLTLVLYTTFFLDPTYAAGPLKPVRIVVGTQTLNIGYPWLTLPQAQALGYWKEEGYDVQVVPLAPPAQPIALLLAGQADFAMVNGAVVVQAHALKNEPVKVAMLNGVTDWSIGVLADSPYKSVKDLKGKVIGTFGLASGGVALLRAYFQDNGMDPDKDVQIIATGSGAPAIDALRSGRVQALVFWATAMASYENAGLKMRYMRGADWRQIPDYSLSVMEKTAQTDPKMVEGIVRGMAKATVFALANPDCARRIQWKTWPSTKPTGSSDDKVLAKWDDNVLNAQLATLSDAFTMTGGKYYGNFDPAAYDRLQQFMLRTKQIPKTVPPSDYALQIPDFYGRANSFDAGAIKQASLKCSGW